MKFCYICTTLHDCKATIELTAREHVLQMYPLCKFDICSEKHHIQLGREASSADPLRAARVDNFLF